MIRPRVVVLLALLSLGGGALAGCELVGPCTSRACAADRQITTAVQARFARQPELQAPNEVYVQTRHEVVYLTGLVDTPFEQQMAQSLAAQVQGVLRVENAIGLAGNAR
jgi:osmotically-inducible protein OsmY